MTLSAIGVSHHSPASALHYTQTCEKMASSKSMFDANARPAVPGSPVYFGAVQNVQYMSYE